MRSKLIFLVLSVKAIDSFAYTTWKVSCKPFAINGDFFAKSRKSFRFELTFQVVSHREIRNSVNDSLSLTEINLRMSFRGQLSFL
jgi:hypothetical protein